MCSSRLCTYHSPPPPPPPPPPRRESGWQLRAGLDNHSVGRGGGGGINLEAARAPSIRRLANGMAGGGGGGGGKGGIAATSYRTLAFPSVVESRAGGGAFSSSPLKVSPIHLPAIQKGRGERKKERRGGRRRKVPRPRASRAYREARWRRQRKDVRRGRRENKKHAMRGTLIRFYPTRTMYFPERGKHKKVPLCLEDVSSGTTKSSWRQLPHHSTSRSAAH